MILGSELVPLLINQGSELNDSQCPIEVIIVMY